MLKESSAEPIRKQHRLASTLIGQLNQVDSVIGRSLSLHCSWAVAVAVAIRPREQNKTAVIAHTKTNEKEPEACLLLGHEDCQLA